MTKMFVTPRVVASTSRERAHVTDGAFARALERGRAARESAWRGVEEACVGVVLARDGAEATCAGRRRMATWKRAWAIGGASTSGTGEA